MTADKAHAAETDFCARAQSALRAGRWAEAEQHLDRALAVNARDDFAFALAGELRIAQGRVPDAILLYARAVTSRPGALAYKERFAGLARMSLAAQWNVDLAGAMLACLSTRELDCIPLSAFWYSLVREQPKLKAACDLPARKNFDSANATYFSRLPDAALFSSPLFHGGLKRLIVCEPVFEEFLTHLRKHLLQQGKRNRATIALAAAIAQYAFRCGYILDVSPEERDAARDLRNDIESGAFAEDEFAVAMLACYSPLYDLDNVDEIHSRFSGSENLRGLMQLQIAEPLELRREAEAIAKLSAIAPGVSRDVQAQYEAFPYPYWDSVSPEKLRRDWEAQPSSRDAEGPLRTTHARILVAGCGTGREVTTLASVFPDAEIIAIDLSRTSLAYAQKKAREYGFRNVSFHQADILELTSWDAQFDYVSAAGVLHHLADPAAGWEICARLLKPGGLMRVGLYSETGRRAICATREIIAKQGYGSDADEMRRFRRDAPSLLSADTMQELIGYRDYFQLSMCRDLLFHVQEHRFTLPQISALLQQLGLVFAGFNLPPETLALYSREYPQDRERTDLAGWDRFEQDHPETFRNMYIFWCRKTPV